MINAFQKTGDFGNLGPQRILNTERVPAAVIGSDELLWHLLLHKLYEFVARAVHGDDVVRIYRFECRYRLAHISLPAAVPNGIRRRPHAPY